MFAKQATNVNVTGGAVGWVSVQLSYSTADIENAVFFGSTHETTPALAPLGTATLLAVNGEMFALDDQTTPTQWPALTEHAGLIQLVAEVEAAHQ